MSLNAATIAVLLAKGLSGEDILEVARAAENKADPTAAERQQRRRDKLKAEGTSHRDVTRDDNSPPPNEYISNPPVFPVETKVSTSPAAEKVVSEWNTHPAAAGAQRSNALTSKRRKHLAARIREVGEDGLLAAIRAVAQSDWHIGKGANGWRADLGWFLESEERVARFVERSTTAPSDTGTTLQTDEERAAYRASLASKPWASGRYGEPPPRAEPQTRGPKPIGSLIPGLVHGHH